MPSILSSKPVAFKMLAPSFDKASQQLLVVVSQKIELTEQGDTLRAHLEHDNLGSAYCHKSTPLTFWNVSK